jgi:hypothetical protein
MNKREYILEIIEDENAILEKKADEAIIGFIERAGSGNCVLYDKEKLYELYKYEPLLLKEGMYVFVKLNLKEILEIDDELLTADGFDKAVIGYAFDYNKNNIVIYETDKCLEVLAKDYENDVKKENPNFTEEEVSQETYSMAMDYFYYNTVGAYMGEKTPGFATMFTDEYEE